MLMHVRERMIVWHHRIDVCGLPCAVLLSLIRCKLSVSAILWLERKIAYSESQTPLSLRPISSITTSCSFYCVVQHLACRDVWSEMRWASFQLPVWSCSIFLTMPCKDGHHCGRLKTHLCWITWTLCRYDLCEQNEDLSSTKYVSLECFLIL